MDMPSLPEWAKKDELEKILKNAGRSVEVARAIYERESECRKALVREFGENCLVENLLIQALCLLLSKRILYLVNCTYPPGQPSPEKIDEMDSEIQVKIGSLVKEILTANVNGDAIIIGYHKPRQGEGGEHQARA